MGLSWHAAALDPARVQDKITSSLTWKYYLAIWLFNWEERFIKVVIEALATTNVAPFSRTVRLFQLLLSLNIIYIIKIKNAVKLYLPMSTIN